MSTKVYFDSMHTVALWISEGLLDWEIHRAAKVVTNFNFSIFWENALRKNRYFKLFRFLKKKYTF